jgi:hypothetical protein
MTASVYTPKLGPFRVRLAPKVETLALRARDGHKDIHEALIIRDAEEADPGTSGQGARPAFGFGGGIAGRAGQPRSPDKRSPISQVVSGRRVTRSAIPGDVV